MHLILIYLSLEIDITLRTDKKSFPVHKLKILESFFKINKNILK